MLDFPLDDPPSNRNGVNSYIEIHLNRVRDVIEHLKVPQLKSLCRSCKLNANNRKFELMEALVNYFSDLFYDSYRMIDEFSCIKYLFQKVQQNEPLPDFMELLTAKYHNKNLDAVPVKQRRRAKATGTKDSNSPQKSVGKKNVMTSPYANSIHFEESPFYKLEKLIPESAQKIYVTNGRCTCTINFNLSKEEFHSLQHDEHQRLYVLCGKVDPLNTRGKAVIQFPSPHEFQMNNQQIVANVKGIKNRPGTAKPADITPYLGSKNAENKFQFVYAFTTVEYILYIYIVRTIPPEAIVQQILSQSKIVKAATLYYLKQTIDDDGDDDFITTSTVMSLNCPISCTRMVNPVKSDMCKHIECFDALWFLHSQMQIPTWQCPICQLPIKIEHLAVSEYVKEILDTADQGVEQVKLFSNGSWEPFCDENENNGGHSDSESESGSSKHGALKKEDKADEFHSDMGNPSPDNAASNHVVISLDSDDDDNNLNQTTTAPSNVSNNIAYNTGDSSDRSMVQRSLDPKKTQMTSFNLASESNDNSAVFGQKNRSTVLSEETSSNSDFSTPLRNTTYENRHPSILNRQIKFPTYLQSNPFFNGETQNGSSNDKNEKDMSFNISQDPSESTVIIQGLDRQRIGIGTGKMESQSLRAENPNVTISHPNDEANIPIEPGNLSTNMEITRDSDIGLRSPSESSRIASVVHTDLEISSKNARSGPVLPDLPSLDTINKVSKKVDDKTQQETTQGSHQMSSIIKKPIVAPFQPRRMYSTTLPQKRQLSNSSQPPSVSER